MEPKKVTKIFVVGGIILASLFDVWVWNAGGTEATISWTVYEWSKSYPVFTFAAGFVGGHLFWQMKKGDKNGGSTISDGKQSIRS